MFSNVQSPFPSSPGEDSTNSVRVLSSPTPVPRDPMPSGSVPDGNQSRTRSVADILRDASNPLDRNAGIISPFDDEVGRDAEFYQS